MESSSSAVAVYCGSSPGTEKAFHSAALCLSLRLVLRNVLTSADFWTVVPSALGHAMAEAKRPLVYGGGSKGLMGVVSGAVLEHGGKVTGIVPYAMTIAGGESEKVGSRVDVQLNEAGREKVRILGLDDSALDSTTRRSST